MGISKK